MLPPHKAYDKCKTKEEFFSLMEAQLAETLQREIKPGMGIRLAVLLDEAEQYWVYQNLFPSIGYMRDEVADPMLTEIGIRQQVIYIMAIEATLFLNEEYNLGSKQELLHYLLEMLVFTQLSETVNSNKFPFPFADLAYLIAHPLVRLSFYALNVIGFFTQPYRRKAFWNLIASRIPVIGELAKECLFEALDNTQSANLVRARRKALEVDTDKQWKLAIGELFLLKYRDGNRVCTLSDNVDGREQRTLPFWISRDLCESQLAAMETEELVVVGYTPFELLSEFTLFARNGYASGLINGQHKDELSHFIDWLKTQITANEGKQNTLGDRKFYDRLVNDGFMVA